MNGMRKTIFAVVVLFLMGWPTRCEAISGQVLRTLSEFGGGWTSDLEWLSGDSTALWIEHPPNDPHLARLVEWDGSRKRVLIPAGVVSMACGTVDSANTALASVMLPDSSDWKGIGIELYRERGECKPFPLPVGEIPGIATWDGHSDSIFYALCTKPDLPPKRFLATFAGDVAEIERPLPPGQELPIGRIPDDTSGHCLEVLFQKSSAVEGDSVPSNFMMGIVPKSDLDFVVDKGTLTIIDGKDSVEIALPDAVSIEEIAWSQDGRRALISTFGHPSRVMLLMLVFSGGN